MMIAHILWQYTGRRRVGKTFLIREAFGYRFAFQHAGLSEGGMKEQIYAFTSSLKDAGYEVKKQPQNWLEAFEALKDVIRLSSRKEENNNLLMSCRGWTHKRVILWLLWRISGMDLLLQEKI